MKYKFQHPPLCFKIVKESHAEDPVNFFSPLCLVMKAGLVRFISRKLHHGNTVLHWINLTSQRYSALIVCCQGGRFVYELIFFISEKDLHLICRQWYLICCKPAQINDLMGNTAVELLSELSCSLCRPVSRFSISDAGFHGDDLLCPWFVDSFSFYDRMLLCLFILLLTNIFYSPWPLNANAPN